MGGLVVTAKLDPPVSVWTQRLDISVSDVIFLCPRHPDTGFVESCELFL